MSRRRPAARNAAGRATRGARGRSAAGSGAVAGGALPVGALAAVVVVAALLPDPVPLGAARLWALAAIVAGASVTVARTGAVDLAVGPTVGVAAVAGGIVPTLLGVPAVVGLPLGAAAGAAVGAVAGATIGRVGRQLGALATLALGGALVAVLAAVELTGGVVGFHAVGLPAAGMGDRADALLVGGVALAVIVGAWRVGRRRTSAAAAVAVADPAVARSLGRAPAGDAAVVGAAGGGLAGVGGTLLAAVDGSVVPAAYGLELTATVVAAAAVGGAGLLGPVLGTVLVWGPATLFPLSPLGTAPVLLTAGPLVLLLLALRRGRPLTHHRTAQVRTPEPPPPVGAAPVASRSGPAAAGQPALRLRGVPTPGGPVHLEVAAGEIVAVIGPNGVGKSTLLARIGGQLADWGTVDLAGAPAPRGARRRAHAGVARTWQRRPSVPDGDADRLAGVPVGTAGGDLARVVARRPRVALLDEPTDHDAAEVAATLSTLTADGAAVLLVDHRPEVVALADRTLHLAAATDVGTAGSLGSDPGPPRGESRPGGTP